jgi:predicted Zn-dependent protease
MTGKKQDALEIFKLNAKRFPKAWPVNVGLARGYSAVGDYTKALKHAKLAANEAPDKLNKDTMMAAVEKLQKKEDIN